jgi:hypothetical protein
MFLAGEFSYKIEAVFCWVRRGFYGFGSWEVKMLWVRVMGVTLVNLVENLTVENRGLQITSSISSPGLKICFFYGGDWGF